MLHMQCLSLRPHHLSSLCIVMGKGFQRTVSGLTADPWETQTSYAAEQSLWGSFWPLLRSTVSVFCLVCLQGQDDETKDSLGQLLSFACQSAVVFSCCQRVFTAVLKPHEVYIPEEQRGYLQFKLQKRNYQGDRWLSQKARSNSPYIL